MQTLQERTKFSNCYTKYYYSTLNMSFLFSGERPFECPMCHKAFSRKANMEMHVVYHTGERRFTCEICGQSFFAINALKRHTKLHTG